MSDDPSAASDLLAAMLSTITSEIAFLAVEIVNATCEMAVMGEAMAAESRTDILGSATALRARADSIQRRMALAAEAMTCAGRLSGSNVIPFPGMSGKDA